MQHGEAIETFPNGTIVHSFYNYNEKMEEQCYIENPITISNEMVIDGLVQKIVDCMSQ